MPLLPIYYTTNNLKKRKKRKSVRQFRAEQEHQAYIDRMKRNSVSGSTTASKPVRVGSSPTSSATLAPCSDVIPVGVAYKKKHTDHNFTIAPAYNKGAYQVISRKDVKDIGK
tara:strand:- start:5105 stop:5440 length:336 start_codon:yes stop_codon:yes gene_type:complete